MFRKQSGKGSNRTIKGTQLTGIYLCILGALAFIAIWPHAHQGPSERGTPTEPNSAAMTTESTPGAENKAPSLLGDAPIVDRLTLLPGEKMAPPPIILEVGEPPGEGPDLSTPAMAVYSVLDLIDNGNLDQLPQCFPDKTGDPCEAFYPRYLGHPIELVDVTEEEDTAEVFWNATVHTAFSVNGRNAAPGETMSLTTRLIRTNDDWKLVKLHE